MIRRYSYSLRNSVSGNFQFVRSCDGKLPLGIAYRIHDLEHMPFGMSDLSTTKTVRDWYLYSFIDMLDFGRPK